CATHGAEVRPEGSRAVTPFLHARGAAAFIDFMKSVFEARELSRDADSRGTIHHAVVQIGDSPIEIGEAHGPYQSMPIGLHVFVDDVDSVYDRALRAGATSQMEPKNEPYGQRVCGVTDQDGNRWFIAALLSGTARRSPPSSRRRAPAIPRRARAPASSGRSTAISPQTRDAAACSSPPPLPARAGTARPRPHARECARCRF